MNSINSLRYAAALLVFVVIYASSTQAESYHFAIVEFPPYEYSGEDNRPQGMAVEVVKVAMNKLGHTIDIGIYPWARALSMVEHGTADALFTVYRKKGRELFLDYSNEPLIEQKIALFTKRGSALTHARDLNSITGKRVGVVSTLTYGNKFEKMRPHLIIDRVETIEQNFSRLILNRIDLLVSNTHVAKWALQTHPYKGEIRMLLPELETLPSYIVFSKKKSLTTLRDRFDQTLLMLKKSGEYQKIVGDYQP